MSKYIDAEKLLEKVIDDIANAPAVSALEDEGEKAHEN